MDYISENTTFLGLPCEAFIVTIKSHSDHTFCQYVESLFTEAVSEHEQ